MKSVQSFTMIGSLAVAAALSAGWASAQNVKGNFTLPLRHVGESPRCQPGTTRSSSTTRLWTARLSFIAEPKRLALIKSQGCNPNNDRTGGSALVVTRDKAGSGPVVTALRLASSGVVFSYAPTQTEARDGA